MRLAEAQQAVQAYVLQGSPAAQSLVRDTPQLGAAQRLDIYRHAFHERLVDALAVNYPALRTVLGADAFGALTHAFVAAFPPRHFSIRYFGLGLERFLAQMPGVRARGLSDLARWEWTLAAAFDAADCQSIGTESLTAIAPNDWNRLQLELAPSLHRSTLTTNAVQWWKSATRAARRPTRWRTTRSSEWAIWRTDLKTYFRSLDTTEAAALDTVRSGACFGRLCAQLAENPAEENPALRAATLLQGWFRDGWICGVQLAAAD